MSTKFVAAANFANIRKCSPDSALAVLEGKQLPTASAHNSCQGLNRTIEVFCDCMHYLTIGDANIDQTALVAQILACGAQIEMIASRLDKRWTDVHGKNPSHTQYITALGRHEDRSVSGHGPFLPLKCASFFHYRCISTHFRASDSSQSDILPLAASFISVESRRQCTIQTVGRLDLDVETTINARSAPQQKLFAKCPDLANKGGAMWLTRLRGAPGPTIASQFDERKGCLGYNQDYEEIVEWQPLPEEKDPRILNILAVIMQSTSATWEKHTNHCGINRCLCSIVWTRNAT
ncbi:hypothetical protein C8R43DRAFT_1112289 [Mycena crocata]|nr:hypothetical protein C8R43DRAFT_1112289 [Mycena crocata]